VLDIAIAAGSEELVDLVAFGHGKLQVARAA
jgi:hypothetical protein